MSSHLHAGLSAPFLCALMCWAGLGEWWDELPWYGKTLVATGAFALFLAGGWALGLPLSLGWAVAGTGVFAAGSATKYYIEEGLATGAIEEHWGWTTAHIAGSLAQMAGMFMALGPAAGTLAKTHPLAMRVVGGTTLGLYAARTVHDIATWDRSQSWHAWARRWVPDIASGGFIAGYGAFRLGRWAWPRARRWGLHAYRGFQRAAVEIYLRAEVGPRWRTLHGEVVPRLRLWYSRPSGLHLRVAEGMVYHGGPRNITQMTARPGQDLRGLSTWTELELATDPGKKAAMIDIGKLSRLRAVYDLDPLKHVTLGDLPAEEIAAWAAGRPEAAQHPLSMELFDIAAELKRPK